VIILSLAVICLVTLDRWNIHPWKEPLDYSRFGNWGEAIAGIGTTAAVMVALVALFRDRANQRATEAKRRIEAETAVFQWLTSKEIRDDTDRPIGRIWDIKIQNSTAAPIYHWQISFESVEHCCNYLKRPLLPGENVFNIPTLDNTEPAKAPEPLLIFEGRSGEIWIRSARGKVNNGTERKLSCSHTPARPSSSGQAHHG
jgi:hypothetical protein